MSTSLTSQPESSPPAPDAPLTLDAIDAGLPAVEAKEQPDVKDRLEDDDTQIVAAKLQNRLSASKIKNVKADRKMRKQYASRILRYLEIYSIGVGIITLLSGFRVWGFTLEVGVLAALVGSTAIAAIGLVGFIAKGLFRVPSD